MPLATWYTGKIIEITTLAPGVRSFQMEIPELPLFEFKAGQFITFDLPVSDKRINRWRSYSIASAPDGSNRIELCIVHFEKGIGSSYFFNEVNIGSELKFKGPEGGFVLPDVLDHDLVLLCTGTGVAPFRSMILDIKNKQIPHRNIHLIFGTRKQEDILYHNELIQLQNELEGFKFSVALSRESTPAEQHDYIRHGYIHPIYQDGYTTYKPDLHFYICGWSQMIDEAVANLFVKMKYPRDQIHYELYG